MWFLSPHFLFLKLLWWFSCEMNHVCRNNRKTLSESYLTSFVPSIEMGDYLVQWLEWEWPHGVIISMLLSRGWNCLRKIRKIGKNSLVWKDMTLGWTLRFQKPTPGQVSVSLSLVPVNQDVELLDTNTAMSLFLPFIKMYWSSKTVSKPSICFPLESCFFFSGIEL